MVKVSLCGHSSLLQWDEMQEPHTPGSSPLGGEREIFIPGHSLSGGG